MLYVPPVGPAFESELQVWPSLKTDHSKILMAPGTPVQRFHLPTVDTDRNEEQGMIIRNLGTIQELEWSFSPRDNSYSPSNSAGSPNNNAHFASVRLARMLLSGPPTPDLSSAIARHELPELVGKHTTTDSNSSFHLSGKGLIEKQKALINDKQLLQERVDELNKIVRRQIKIEEMLKQKVKNLEQMIEHMVSTKVSLVEEASKALSTVRMELSRVNLCNKELGKVLRDEY